jgi:class 3 adenylate cyclase
VRPPFPLVAKITGASFLVALGVLAFVAQAEYKSERAQLQDKFGLTLQHIAQTAALFIDGDAHERVRGQGDAGGPDFQRLRAVLDRVRAENELGEDQIYTLRPASGGALEFVAMLQRRTFIGDRYTPPPATRDIVRWVLADGRARYTPLYRDENGTYVSAYAPIRDRAGRVVALLEVDYAVDRFVAELRKQLQRKLWMVPAALLLALLLSTLVARSITGAVAQLVNGTAAVQQGRYDHRVVVDTRDELRTLAEAFNDMLVGLRERFAMLKFLPRHTRAVIAEAAKEHGGLPPDRVARRREVTVLFSDIRGFTALSESLPAERVIEMLNIYLREEAEIIEQEGGSVDKFIGDAVMALFEGPERCERAARAALRIQRAIRSLNEHSAFERAIDVGIGVADGEVVMGNVGYEGRLEFAVIGRIVNLASRLTSVAQKGDVMVEAAVYQALGGRYQGERLEGLRLKGFASEVTCYRISEPGDPGRPRETPGDPGRA